MNLDKKTEEILRQAFTDTGMDPSQAFMLLAGLKSKDETLIRTALTGEFRPYDPDFERMQQLNRLGRENCQREAMLQELEKTERDFERGAGAPEDGGGWSRMNREELSEIATGAEKMKRKLSVSNKKPNPIPTQDAPEETLETQISEALGL